MTEEKKYDIVLFGVTGFTGRLAVEYLLKNYSKDAKVKLAGCARNLAKAQAAVSEIAVECSVDNAIFPIVTADLVCDTPEKEATLKQVVSQTKVVLTCSGPFEKYGTTLVKLCAELGVHYADITGETDFVRSMISQHDATARRSGAHVVSHCGNDCIPQDLTVYEMHRHANAQNMQLIKAATFTEVPPSATFSGGTLATAQYQLGKDRSGGKTDFDPMLTGKDGAQSKCSTKNTSPKQDVFNYGLQEKVGPWIMAPVMVNCVRRSNALLEYSESLQYGEAMVKKDHGWMQWAQSTGSQALLGAAIAAPTVFGRFLPQPGQGPTRETMESGYLILHGRATLVKDSDTTKSISTTFRFNKDIGYLYTAALLVETGMLLLQKPVEAGKGGCLTPAASLGHDLTQRILDKLDTSWELKEEDE